MAALTATDALWAFVVLFWAGVAFNRFRPGPVKTARTWFDDHIGSHLFDAANWVNVHLLRRASWTPTSEQIDATIVNFLVSRGIRAIVVNGELLVHHDDLAKLNAVVAAIPSGELGRQMAQFHP